jgi:hypothetical protein
MERVKAAAGMGGDRGGTLPRLGTAEEGWERKEGEGTRGGRGGGSYGGAGYSGAGAGSGTLGGGYGYEGQEVRFELRWRFEIGQASHVCTLFPTLHITPKGGDGRPSGQRPRKVPKQLVRLLA